MSTLRTQAEAFRETLLGYAALIDDLLHHCPPEEAATKLNGVANMPVNLRAATEAAAIAILEEREPATTREILEAIHDRVPIGGKNPLATLSARLSLSRRVKNGRGGWRRIG